MDTKIHALPESVTPKIIARFYATIHEPNENGCRLWKNKPTGAGYGMVSWGASGQLLAHRFAWMVANGPIPDGLHVCHKCDVRNCVNIDHMFLGTMTDNMHDASVKGRMDWKPTHPRRVQPERSARGSRNSNTKLNPDIIREIRRLRADGMILRVIGERFGIHFTTVSDILRGKVWSYVTDADPVAPA